MIVCIRVPQADWRAKPIYLNGNVYKGTYMPSVKSSTTELSIRLSKELSKGLSETAANIYKMIYADNYITRSEIANRIGISVTAVQKHINKLKLLRFIDRDGSTGHGNWMVIE